MGIQIQDGYINIETCFLPRVTLSLREGLVVTASGYIHQADIVHRHLQTL